jgi:hypothetical protein
MVFDGKQRIFVQYRLLGHFKIVESGKNMILKGKYKRRLIPKLFLNLIDSLVGKEFHSEFFVVITIQ